MNPPEAGLFDLPKIAAPKVEKTPDAGADTKTISTPPPPVKPKPVDKAPRLKPAPVDSKDLPLGPLISPSILVEKSALRLTVFDGDAGVKSYRVAAGAVAGDKQCEGDRKTPEGDFYICIRKTKEQTRYTRSMGLSYPNLEDAQRGRRDGLITASQYYSIAQAIKNNRKPPWQTKLGGAIMIHGKRENRTGTLGCIALDDDDIIELYNRLPLNTPVRIIP
jgi:murein L,D-transpeptidase YafK